MTIQEHQENQKNLEEALVLAKGTIDNKLGSLQLEVWKEIKPDQEEVFLSDLKEGKIL